MAKVKYNLNKTGLNNDLPNGFANVSKYLIHLGRRKSCSKTVGNNQENVCAEGRLL